MRVRLVHPLVIELARLDTPAIRAADDYDPIFGEPRVELRNGKRIVDRKEKAPVRLRAQISDQVMDGLRMFDSGNSPETKLEAILSMKDLIDKGLVDQDRQPTIHVTDRLVAIYATCGDLVQRIKNPPGLYAVEVRPGSYGLWGGRASIVTVRFSDRARSAQG